MSRPSVLRLQPPRGYSSWLEYAVATMDTRSLQNDHEWGNQPQWHETVSREQMRAAAASELQDLFFKKAKADSAEIEKEIIAADGGSADDVEFAASAACTIPQLLMRSSRHEFFCVECRGARYWPRWQLGLPGLSEILAALSENEASGFSAVLFFTTPTEVLLLDDAAGELPDVRENDSPLSLLRRCGTAAVSRVVRHARRFGQHGAP